MHALVGRQVQVTKYSLLAMGTLRSQLGTLRAGYNLTSKPSQCSKLDELIRSPVVALLSLGFLKPLCSQ